MITFNQYQRRRESYINGGWNINIDDDLPRAPECNDLDSAQRKRYIRETLCGIGGHQSAGSTQAHPSGTPRQGCDQEGQSHLD